MTTMDDRLLFITSRNILETSGELRLVKNRALALKNDYKINTDYIAYRIRVPQAKDADGVNKRIIVYRNPFDYFTLKSKIGGILQKREYLCVILSGGFVLHTASFIKKEFPRMKVLVDLHGTIEELREYGDENIPNQVLRRILYQYSLYYEKKTVAIADGVLSVSYALINSVEKEINAKIGRYFIIPCSINYVVDINSYQQWRNEYREKYNIEDHDIVLVYSGGNSQWQCVDESVKLFERLKNRNNQIKMFLFSKSYELRNKYKNREGLIVDSIHPDDVQKVLCAADYGIMLRKKCETNRVAFPNKFLEYVSAGLKVICTPYVEDVAKYVREYGVGVVVRNEHDVNPVLDDFKHQNHASQNFKNAKRLVYKCSFRNTLKDFVDYIRGGFNESDILDR